MTTALGRLSSRLAWMWLVWMEADRLILDDSPESGNLLLVRPWRGFPLPRDKSLPLHPPAPTPFHF